MESQLQTISSDIKSTRDRFNAALIDPSIKFDAEAAFALQALQGSDHAMKVALANRQALADAIVNIAAIGLSLNPAKKHAYLIPRCVGPVTKIVLAISYQGIIELATASGSIRAAKSVIVRERDTFVYNGMTREPTHTFSPFSKDRGPIVGVYCVAKTADGDYLTEMMSVDEVNSIRDRSDSWRAFQEKKIKSCPWSTDWPEMAKKTCLIRAGKYWPKTDRLDKATHYLNTEGGEALAELAQGTPPAASFNADEWVAKANEAKTEEALLKVYGEAMGAAAAARDREGARAFREAALARRAELRNANVTDV